MDANVLNAGAIPRIPAVPWKGRAAALLQGRAGYVLASLLLLAPCYWQPRLQAGDLSSHIYNAWLAQLIESGRTQGLVIVRQTTNILFDLILAGLFRILGAEAAQRIAVSAAVLVFIWGAFAFVWTVSGRRSWHLLPCIAMFAYGWVFHMGFFNFYLSIGLCFWGMALMWNARPKRIAAAVPVFILAYLAHALPVVWMGGLMLYLFAARRVRPLHRAILTAALVMALAAFHAFLSRTLVTRWSPTQITMTTGLDQVWIFDTKYYIVLMGLLAVWGLLFLSLLRGNGARRVIGGIPFQLCVIGAAGVFILPSTVLIPGFSHALSYIAERMSLGVAICVCAVLGSVRPRALERWLLAGIAVVFFGFIYHDERALNSFEDRMQDVVSMLPPGQRVVSPIWDLDLRINALNHMIDRVCVGRCYSYGNYEASTAQFRIRAVAPNPYVASTYAQSWYIQTGAYVVKPRDLPLYKVDVDSDGRILIKILKAGVPCGSTTWKTLKNWLPNS